jgi:hypothetical protein
MDEQRKYAILFAATILAARKLNDPESKTWGIEVAISDAIEKAKHIFEKIDERWPKGRDGGSEIQENVFWNSVTSSGEHYGNCPVRASVADTLGYNLWQSISPAMKCAARIAMSFVVAFWVLVSSQAFAGPGGHGGGGGHGAGGHGGSHSSRGSSTGNVSAHAGRGHSIGHSIAHFIGRHSKTADGSQPPAANPMLVEMVPQANPDFVSLHRLHTLNRGPHRGHFGVGGCPAFGFEANRLLWRDGFNCFKSGFFFFDPFFFGRFSSAGWYNSPAFGSGPIDPAEAPLPASPDRSDSYDMSSTNFSPGNDVENKANGELPMTLLQLRDGSMYGLTEYWIEGDELHYVTTYGGQNSVPIQRIDFEKTASLNADRGVEFVLRPKPAH